MVSGAWDDYLELQTDKAALKKVNKLLEDVMRNGYQDSYGKSGQETGEAADPHSSRKEGMERSSGAFYSCKREILWRPDPSKIRDD